MLLKLQQFLKTIPKRYLSLKATDEPEKFPDLFCIFLTFPPAENALPAPVRITHRISLSLLIKLEASSKLTTSSGSPKGLRISGRFIVKVAIEPFFSNFNQSFILIKPYCLNFIEPL